MRAALAAIEWPDDELSVFATLKGSLFAIDDAHLLEFRQSVRRSSSLPDSQGARRQFRSGARADRRSRPTHLTPDCRCAAAAAGAASRAAITVPWPTRSAACWPRRARTSASFSGRPASRRLPTCCTWPSWRASTRRAAASRSAGSSTSCGRRPSREAAEAPILEESSDGVRLMTVHKAKGLEFPVVILADMTCRLSRSDASRYLDPAVAAVRHEDRRVGAARAPRARGRRSRARSGGRRSAGLRRRDARARSARRAGARRRTVGRRLGCAAQPGAVSAARPASHAGTRERMPGVQVEGHRAAAARTRRRPAPSTVAPGEHAVPGSWILRGVVGSWSRWRLESRHESRCSACGATT